MAICSRQGTWVVAESPIIIPSHPPAKKPQKYCILFVFLVGFFGIMGGWTGLRPGPENAQKALIIPCILLL